MNKLAKIYLTLASALALLAFLLDDSPRKWTRSELLFDLQVGVFFPVYIVGALLILLGSGERWEIHTDFTA